MQGQRFLYVSIPYLYNFHSNENEKKEQQQQQQQQQNVFMEQPRMVVEKKNEEIIWIEEENEKDCIITKVIPYNANDCMIMNENEDCMIMEVIPCSKQTLDDKIKRLSRRLSMGFKKNC